MTLQNGSVGVCTSRVPHTKLLSGLVRKGLPSESKFASRRRVFPRPQGRASPVAESNATSAVAVRHEIAAKVKAGQSDNEILTSLESTYGTSILLSPPTSGLGVLLWVVPVAGLGLLVASSVRLARRRR